MEQPCLSSSQQIFFGAFRSVKSHKEQSDESKRTGEAPETMTRRDAMMFPLIASCALFGLYVFFQVSLRGIILT